MNCYFGLKVLTTTTAIPVRRPDMISRPPLKGVTRAFCALGCAWMFCLLITITAVRATERGSSNDWNGWQPEQGPFHFTGQYCKACHETVPTDPKNSQLKYGGRYDILCKCHTPQNYVHPVDIAPSKLLSVRIPSDLPLEKNKLTCLTCHDLHQQCNRRDFDKT